MDYQLPRTTGEARRLEIQSGLLREGTERLLDALPLRPGMTCLDVGCGTGDVMELLAARIGAGRVVGLDLDVGPARARVARIAGTHAAALDVVQGDLFGIGDATYDLVISRYVMHHMTDPVAALARMWSSVRPGGVLAVLDIDQRGTTAYPSWPPYDEIERLIAALYRKLGIDNHIGHKLPALFEQAGVGPPDGTQVTGVIRTIAQLAEFLPLLLDMVRGKLVAHGVATEASLDELAAALARAGEQTSTYCYRPMLVGAWRARGRARE